ncbi:hypothetical protein D5820_14195 [Salmonella enterica subsp. enterica serovar Enteritidis]|nr:hypothetical protein [Salmonella enterica]EBS0925057.1 hypothetical protein [Salmonella enterica subsp. enterica serovar Enteritidis]EBV2774117.1 hypothetical protein [Salmonella enterica subsp. enterica serovar Enteritidis]EBW5502176.1 hypothetical protein [Salmonella enterica subsp. enterica serovar Enteritidis]ECA8068345.1 hypothetical protein [Salmonella enterica subsp. enterica serovar Enteritidis]
MRRTVWDGDFFRGFHPAGRRGYFRRWRTEALVLTKVSGVKLAAAASGMLMTSVQQINMSARLLLSAEYQVTIIAPTASFAVGVVSCLTIPEG